MNRYAKLISTAYLIILIPASESSGGHDYFASFTNNDVFEDVGGPHNHQAFNSCHPFTASDESNTTQGYYKDVFMDGGVGLTHRATLPAAESLILSMEYIATDDTSVQKNVIVSNEYDYNGVLLYPDGAPRFRIIYTNGGKATPHGNSLKTEGRQRIKDFYLHGGSYVGTCAGAFIASKSLYSTGIYEPYYDIWPGRTIMTNLDATITGHFIPANSPLLKYYSFGNDLYIADVHHDGGCYMRTDIDFPANSEILLNYDYPSLEMHHQPSCIAYKESTNTGRLVIFGSHPENEISGEKLALMKGMIQYALDGIGGSVIKGKLDIGISRYMDKSTEDKIPGYTKIGDKQYHHFIIDVPANKKQLKIIIQGESGYHLNVYASRNKIAFAKTADYYSVTDDYKKTLTIQNPASGQWYIGVECATTVETIKKSWGSGYTGKLKVLNGISYSIRAEIKDN